MDKKGASHADWAVSLGIFLLYILSMLMLIQPGVQPFYKNDELLNVVTENYKNETSFVFYKTPLVIDTIKGDFTPESMEYLVTINAAFPFSGLPNDYAITGEDMVPLENFYIANDWSVVRFKAPITDTPDNKFYIINNKLADGSSKSYLDRGDASPGSGLEISNSDIAPHTPNFTLIIGSTETLQGVSADLLERDVDDGGINCLDADETAHERKYNAIKGQWGFPRSKDFIVLYSNIASAQYNPTDYDSVENPTGNIIPVCRYELPYEQASVVVEEWATRMFVPNEISGEYLGETKPIRMVVWLW
ncbi:MAG: hypothetical protein PHO02_03915 [Candidatus Nanoarchaeia archaeon]|nr:hypothetical protein [Candidatus Nanoarchaeia archaeon]